MKEKVKTKERDKERGKEKQEQKKRETQKKGPTRKAELLMISAISSVWTRHSPLSKLYPGKLMVVTLTLTSLMLT